MSDPDRTTEASAIFALGHMDASLLIVRILPDDISEFVFSALAFRLLSRLWHQYRIDRGINHGRTLLSPDNSFEIRVFADLIDRLAEWEPLRKANGILRAHSPALSVDERRVYDQTSSLSLDAIDELSEMLDRQKPCVSPFDALSQLVDQCQKFDDVLENGACWALNLVCALRSDRLGLATRAPPCPALLRREMFRFDRSKIWRRHALVGTVAESAHETSNAICDLNASFLAFQTEFSALRRHSRLQSAFTYLCGIGELTPSHLGRLLACSEPGARKMLAQLADAGLASRRAPSPAFFSISKFKLGFPSGAWLYSSNPLASATMPEYPDFSDPEDDI